MKHAPTTSMATFLRLLKISPFQQRSGGWRFGTKRISNDVVSRLIASGAARVEGDKLIRTGGASPGAPSAALSIRADGAPVGAG